METMNYNKINKSKFGMGLVTFTLFIVLGTVVIVFSMLNEEVPTVIGQDALIKVYDENKVIETVAEPMEKISYKINSTAKKETTENFKANISLPRLLVGGEELTEINNKIYSRFEERYNTLKEENAKELENKFTYKVTYKKYETALESGETIISFTIYERIIDDSRGIDTMYKIYGYTVNLNTKTFMTQEDVGPLLLGPTYKTIIREKVKSYVINSKMMAEKDYIYSITGLEEFYVKSGIIHIIFNTGELVNKKYEHLDIEIKD